MLIVLLLFTSFPFRPPAWAADSQPSEKAAEQTPAAAPSQGEIEGKLKNIQQQLADNRSGNPEMFCKQLHLPLEQFQEKTAVLQEIEATYQRQLTSLAKQSSLTEELKNLNQQIESPGGSLVSQLPPYSLSTYDLYLDQLAKAIQREETASNTRQIDKQNLDDARSDLEEAAQQLRLLTDKSAGGEKAGSPARDLQITIARLNNELAEATLNLNQYSLENSKLELQIAQLQKKLTQQQADWVKTHLTYDEQDLQERLKLLDGLRQKLKTLMESLATEQQEVEDAWLKAQHDYSGTGTNDELKRERNKSSLDARQAWRDTYQQVLEQTENSLRLISLGKETWQRRYAILKGEVSYDQFARWKQETTETIHNISRLIDMAQIAQSNLQPQISSLKIQLARQEVDSVVAQNYRTSLDALNKLLDRTVEYLARLQTISRFENRFLDEVSVRQKSVSLPDILNDLEAKFHNTLNYELWVIDDQSVTIKKVMVAVLILLIGLRLAKYISRFTTNRILLRTKLDESDRAIFDRILYFLMLVLLVLFALHTVNIPLTALTFLGGAFAIGVGFGTQNLLNNFISGFILMLERPVKIGDTIEFENTLGTIEEIGIRCTKIRTASNVHILVPNSSLLEKNIVNWTLSDQIIRCQVRVGVGYGSPVDEVAKLLAAAAGGHEAVLKTPEPIVIFTDFGDSALIFDVYYWIRLSSNSMEKMIVESGVRFLIERYLRERGISIPFPQRDLHLDAAEPLKVRIYPASGSDDLKGP